MKLVATVRAATNLESAVDALEAAAGLTRAEARMRLVPEPPMLLASLLPEGGCGAAALTWRSSSQSTSA